MGAESEVLGSESGQRIAGSLVSVLRWSAARDYEGYSKFDVFNSRLMRLASLNSSSIRAIMTAAWARSPVNLRPLVGITRSRNPKGIALFALAYLRRFQTTGESSDRKQAESLLSWLDDHHTPGWSGKCWGYDHPWQSAHFFAPRYSPNIVVTGNVIYAFLEAYEVMKEPRYLATARSAVDFILQDLGGERVSTDQPNIRYVPSSDWAVLNINGLAAVVLARTAAHTGEDRLFEIANRLIGFLADKQTDYGAWHYAWPAKTSNVKHDNYHTGNILDWLLDYTLITHDDTYLDRYRRGLEFYCDNLFLTGGQPKWRSDRTWPADTHSAAQAIVTFSKAAEHFDASFLDHAQRTADWAIDNLQATDGRFIYQMGRFWRKSYTLMRWCNAWMSFALSSLLLTSHRLRAS